MPDATRRTPPHKNHPTVHAIVSAWRRFTGGGAVRDPDRRTLIACSGGSDSSALVLALAHHPSSIVVAHIVHDMRPPVEAQACFGAAEALAGSLGLPFVASHIRARNAGSNYESEARTLRYSALAALAEAQGCRYVATGHHAEDQLETILLRLLRGTGPRGLTGIRARRRLTPEVTLVRPMLGITKADTESLCRQCGWTWSEDATNADLSHRRAALRAHVLPALAVIEPGAPAKAVEAARLALLTSDHLESAAKTLDATALVSGEAGTFRREVLRSADKIVLLTWLRALDRRAPQRSLLVVAKALRDSSGEARTFRLGEHTVSIHSNRVMVSTKAE